MHVVLNSFGASIRKENGLFEISTAELKQLVHPKDVKTITVSKGARISSDAVLLAIEEEVDVMFTDGLGNPKGRVWSIKYGSVSDIRRKQLEFFYSDKAVAWVKDGIAEKINNQVAMLLSLTGEPKDKSSRLISSAVNGMQDYLQKVRSIEGESVSDIAPSLRGWEGAASRRYFQVLGQLMPEDFQFSRRSKHPAEDRFNSMLNYGYGMMYGKVEGALIKAGIDPYIGIFHRDDYNRPALVFDIIEKYRVWIDYVVIHLAMQEALTADCFDDGMNGYMLQGLGKRIVIQSVNDYLAEIIHLNGAERSRGEHIMRDARKLAAFFLKS